MVGRLQIDKTDRWVEYVEKLYQSGKLQSTATSLCQFIKLDGKQSTGHIIRFWSEAGMERGRCLARVDTQCLHCAHGDAHHNSRCLISSP